MTVVDNPIPDDDTFKGTSILTHPFEIKPYVSSRLESTHYIIRKYVCKRVGETRASATVTMTLIYTGQYVFL